ncbi:hypothetical protein QP166_18420 [Sphingomonas sp. LR60]|uniref:VOC family protein n=1 Tax=Sphingomonas sp. LR60 TaxID=3050233 RepID=UPI002FE204E8
MATLGLDHYNLRVTSDRLDALVDFYVCIVGLKVGHRPAVDIDGRWLYANGRDVLHIAVDDSVENSIVAGRQSINHVAFLCDNLPAVRDTLGQRSIPFETVEDEAVGAVQLFLSDPDGRGIELIFKR